MSLNVYLNKATKITCPVCGHVHPAPEDGEDVFSANITHNLANMAREAGIYGIVWRPEDNEIERAEQMIELLEEGIALMKADRMRFKVFDSPNGWGLYENFLPWLEEYLAACKEYPDATVSASR